MISKIYISGFAFLLKVLLVLRKVGGQAKPIIATTGANLHAKIPLEKRVAHYVPMYLLSSLET